MSDFKPDTAVISSMLSAKEKWSYGAGEIASNVAWNMVTGFLLFYYTDVALLPVAALGTLMLLTRVLDALFDPLVGVFVDRTRSRFGKARPYLRYVTLPFGILCVATFTVPELSPTWKLIYAYVTFTALGLLYSLLYIPYSALLPMMTKDPVEKVQLGSMRSMGTSIASIFVYGLTLPIVHYIGGGDQQAGFTWAAVIMASITMALYALVYFNCRERLTQNDVGRSIKVSVTIKQMLRNPVWRLVYILALLIFIRLGVLVSCVPYFAKDVLKAPWMISVLLPLLSVAILAGGFLAGLYLRKIDKRRANITALLISILSMVCLPFLQGNSTAFLFVFWLSHIVIGIQAATTFVMMADAVDVHEARHGYRAEGLLSSSISFGIKVGMAIGTAATAYVLGWSGYDPLQSSGQANAMVSGLFYVVPVGLMLLQILCVSFYRLDEKAVQKAVANTPSQQTATH